MWYVYILKSRVRDWHYLGSTGNMRKRFKQHNTGEVQSTKHYAPFELEAYVAVKKESIARELEKYFKTGSGRAVLKKRILQSTSFSVVDPPSPHLSFGKCLRVSNLL